MGKEGESLSDGIDGSALYPLEENGQNGQTSENDAVRQNGQTSDETDAKNSPNASDRTVSEGYLRSRKACAMMNIVLTSIMIWMGGNMRSVLSGSG